MKQRNKKEESALNMNNNDLAENYDNDKVDKTSQKFDTYEEFYENFLKDHSKPLTKLFHTIGTGLAFIFLLCFLWPVSMLIMKDMLLTGDKPWECPVSEMIFAQASSAEVKPIMLLYAVVCKAFCDQFSHIFIQ